MDRTGELHVNPCKPGSKVTCFPTYVDATRTSYIYIYIVCMYIYVRERKIILVSLSEETTGGKKGKENVTE
jgi:hypothetical protein